MADIDSLKANVKRLKLEIKRAKKDLKEAKDNEAVNVYFHDKTNLQIVQEICENLVGERGETVNACMDHLKGVYINIYDYVEGDYEQTCFSLQDLKKRCIKRGYFKLDRAKNEHLKALLKKLFF